MSTRPSDAGSIRSDLKIIVIGPSGTGKTSYVNKWTKNIFNDKYKATIVSEFGFKIFEHEGKLYRIQLWDLGGQDKNSTITKIFAKDSHGCIIVSDSTDQDSLLE
jgi:small GTP-binding protein